MNLKLEMNSHQLKPFFPEPLLLAPSVKGANQRKQFIAQKNHDETTGFSVNLLVRFSLNYQNKIVIFNRIKHVFFLELGYRCSSLI